MNYIYDIFLNLNTEFYDFYDWNRNDDVKHIRKIPIFKISNSSMNDILNNKVCIDSTILNKFKNRSEVFNKGKVDIIESLALFTDSENIIAILFNSDGISYKYSKLLIDEELEILDICDGFNKCEIKYKIIEKLNKEELLTREELYRIKYVKDKLKVIINDNKYDLLYYIYYESFNNKESLMEKIVSNINEVLDNKNIDSINKLYSVLNLIYSKN